MGLLAFLGQLQLMNSEQALAQLPPEQQELYRTIPTWVMVCFAVAVLFGVAGCVGLLMKKRISIALFVISLVGVIGQQTYHFFLSDIMKIQGTPAIVFSLAILGIAIFLVFYSRARLRTL